MAKRPKTTLVVKFGNTSVGSMVGRVGITIPRGGDSGLEVAQADELFSETQLVGVLEITPKKGAKGQKSMIADQYPKIEGTFDVKGFGTKAEQFTCSLSFNKHAVDANALGDFAGKSGKFSILEINELPEPKNGKDKEDGADEEDQVAEDDE